MFKKFKNENIALGPQGEKLDISPEDIRAYSLSFLDDPQSKILLIIAEKPNKDLLVNVFDPPSRRIYNLLAQALEQYDNALKLNGV